MTHRGIVHPWHAAWSPSSRGSRIDASCWRDFVHEMVNAESGETAAITELTGVHIDRAARKAVPLPDTVVERMRAMIST